jgi:hypothetical protein
MSGEIIITAAVRVSQNMTTFHTYFYVKKDKWCEVVWRSSSINPICIQGTEELMTEIRGACSALLLPVTAAALSIVFDSLNIRISSPTEGMDIVHACAGCRV